MATTIEELQVMITANTRDVVNQLKDVKLQFKTVEKSVKDATQTINNNFKESSRVIEETAKSRALKLAAIYRKEGMSQSDAMKKAWAEIERTSEKHSGGIKNNIKGIGGSFGGVSKAILGVTAALGVATLAIKTTISAVKGVVNAIKPCLELGSDLQEVQNVVDVTFGSMSESVNKFAKSAIKSYGLSETVAKKYMGTFGAMSKSFGLSTKQSYKMAEAITGLTGDVASFYNLSSDEAYTKMKSIWTGETESLKDLGVVMTQNALDQYALANGYGKTTRQMTEAEKVMLRYAFVQDKLKNASGDFERTSGGWANQMRVLSLQFDSLRASLGQGFINVLTPVVQMLNALLARLQTLASYFKQFTEVVMGSKPAESSGMSTEVASLQANAEGASESVDGIGTSAEKAKKKVQALAGVDEINKLGGNDTSESGAVNAGASDLGLSDIDTSGVDKANDEVKTKITAVVDNLKEKYNEIKELFKKGFEVGLDGNFDGGSIMDKIKAIKEALKSIFDADMVGAFGSLFNTLVYDAGKVSGAMASIGHTIAENVLGGIGKYLEQNSSYISDRLLRIMNSISGISGNISNLFSNVADIFKVFKGEEAQQLTANILAIFGNALLGVTDLIMRLYDDVTGLCDSLIAENKAKITTMLEGTIGVLKTLTGTVSTIITDTFSVVLDAYDAYVSPFIDSLKDGVSQLYGVLLDGYNQYVAPVLQKLADEFDKYYQSDLKGYIEKVVAMLGEAFEIISIIYSKAIAPIISTLASTLMPLIGGIIDILGGGLMTTIKTVASVLGGVVDSIRGVLEVIKGIWLGDFELIKSGTLKIVKGLLTAIKEATFGWFSNICDWLSSSTRAAIFGIGEAINNYVQNGFAVIDGLFGDFIVSALAKLFQFGDRAKAQFNSLLDSGIEIFATLPKKIEECFEGVMGFLKGVFTLDFKSVFEGLSSIAKAIFGESLWNDLKNTFLKGLNFIIGKINTMVSSLNAIKIPLPDAFGGGEIGFDIPQIPKLAKGGIVNNATLAMIGESGGEAVIPLERNTAGLDMLADKLADRLGGARGEAMTVELSVNLGGERLAPKIVKTINDLSRARGKCVINV